jgi:predicted house-cleaning noncanonical NTP pyrophosphatase (MazG superfamily)
VSLKDEFPKVYNNLDNEYDELRYLVAVDENYDDIDSDEFDAFNPEDYNYIVYVNDRIQEIIGESGMKKLVDILENQNIFEDFLATDIDNYGVKSDLSEDGVAKKILEIVEGMIS